jgi:hypothetical protein
VVLQISAASAAMGLGFILLMLQGVELIRASFGEGYFPIISRRLGEKATVMINMANRFIVVVRVLSGADSRLRLRQFQPRVRDREFQRSLLCAMHRCKPAPAFAECKAIKVTANDAQEISRIIFDVAAGWN